MTGWKKWLSQIIGLVVIFVLIFFFGSIVKSFYAHHSIFAYIVPLALIGYWIYTTIRDRGKEKTDDED